jgi:hypothetical protein
MGSQGIWSLSCRSVGFGALFWLFSSVAVASQQPTTPGTLPANSGAPAPNAATKQAPAPAATGDQLPENLFLKLDKNHDKVISDSELTSPDAAPYLAKLKQADRDGNNRITLEEFNQIGEVPLFQDPRTAAAVLLILAFAAFCMFLDGLFDSDHREYFWHSVAGMVVCVACAYFLGQKWFLAQTPYLGYVVAAPIVVMIIAALAGGMREKEEAPAAPAGPVVFQVGKKPGDAAAGKKAAATSPPRKPPPRTPRPAPLPRPPVPERRPSAAPPSTPPAAPRPAPPRPPSARPPAPGPKPPPKPPPGKP